MRVEGVAEGRDNAQLSAQLYRVRSRSSSVSACWRVELNDVTICSNHHTYTLFGCVFVGLVLLEGVTKGRNFVHKQNYPILIRDTVHLVYSKSS